MTHEQLKNLGHYLLVSLFSFGISQNAGCWATPAYAQSFGPAFIGPFCLNSTYACGPNDILDKISKEVNRLGSFSGWNCKTNKQADTQVKLNIDCTKEKEQSSKCIPTLHASVIPEFEDASNIKYNLKGLGEFTKSCEASTSNSQHSINGRQQYDYKGNDVTTVEKSITNQLSTLAEGCKCAW